jgi:hypothetical protein
MFKTRTQAVIGVSLSNERHPANVIYNKNKRRQQVEVFAVNEKRGVYRGERVYRRISEIPVHMGELTGLLLTFPPWLWKCTHGLNR